MATEPRIYSKNYVNSDDTFSVSSGATSIANAYDRDNSSQWVSSGANSDSTPVIITVTFYEGSVAVSRTFDTVLLINHNLKDYTLEWWDGANWNAFITQAADTNATSTYGATQTALATFTAVTTTQVRLTANATQTPNQEKAIGELVICKLALDIGLDLTTYDVAYRQRVKDLNMGEGSLKRAVIRWTYNRIQKYECNWSISWVPEATKLALLAIKEAGDPFLWYPEGVTKPDEIWYVHWFDPSRRKYLSFVKSAGWVISGNFKEI